jgi:hypothetical protein
MNESGIVNPKYDVGNTSGAPQYESEPADDGAYLLPTLGEVVTSDGSTPYQLASAIPLSEALHTSGSNASDLSGFSRSKQGSARTMASIIDFQAVLLGQSYDVTKPEDSTGSPPSVTQRGTSARQHNADRYQLKEGPPEGPEYELASSVSHPKPPPRKSEAAAAAADRASTYDPPSSVFSNKTGDYCEAVINGNSDYYTEPVDSSPYYSEPILGFDEPPVKDTGYLTITRQNAAATGTLKNLGKP